MDRRRPAAVIGAFCASVALLGVPEAVAQPLGPNPAAPLDELPVLSELPPLPTDGEDSGSSEETDESDFGLGGMSGVQTVALGLAGTVLVAGGVGLAVVTRRGKGEGRQAPGDRRDPDHPGDRRDADHPGGGRDSGDVRPGRVPPSETAGR